MEPKGKREWMSLPSYLGKVAVTDHLYQKLTDRLFVSLTSFSSKKQHAVNTSQTQTTMANRVVDWLRSAKTKDPLILSTRLSAKARLISDDFRSYSMSLHLCRFLSLLSFITSELSKKNAHSSPRLSVTSANPSFKLPRRPHRPSNALSKIQSDQSDLIPSRHGVSSAR